MWWDDARGGGGRRVGRGDLGRRESERQIERWERWISGLVIANRLKLWTAGFMNIIDC